MKIVRAIICMLVCVLTLSACNKNNDAKLEPNETTFLLSILNACDADIYRIRYEYYLSETPVGGGICGNADGTVLLHEDFIKDFIEADFPEKSDLSTFRIEFRVLDKDGKEFACNSIVPLPVEYGNTYKITLSGNYEDGFLASISK